MNLPFQKHKKSLEGPSFVAWPQDENSSSWFNTEEVSRITSTDREDCFALPKLLLYWAPVCACVQEGNYNQSVSGQSE